MAAAQDPRHALGRLGEDLALEHLMRRGYRPVTRNYRTRVGEIDLIVCDERTLVFCEVKTRRLGSGHPWWNLGPQKCRRVRHRAGDFLTTVDDRPRSVDIRFDAIGVVIDAAGRLIRLDHLEGAF